MGRFRKIDTRIHNDAKFRSMSETGKLVFLCLLTHPHLTMVGAMRASVPGLAAEFGMELGTFTKAFQEALVKGMAKHDADACFLWLPNFLKYNRPESPNVVRSWPDAFDMLPECSLKVALFQHVKEYAEGLTKGFMEAFTEVFAKALSKGMPNQEQEQEQEQEDTPPPPARYAERAEDVKRDVPWSEDEIPPEGLPVLVYARGMLELLAIPLVMATEQAAAAAIGAYRKERGGIAANIATWELTRHARDALRRGENVDKWWFTDAKWRVKQQEVGESGRGSRSSTGGAVKRVEQSRGAFRRAAERRGVSGVDGLA